MLNFLYKCVTPWAKANTLEIFKNRLLGYIANFIYPFEILLKPIKREEYREKNNEVIVSLTTYPDRINQTYLCLNSILRQNCKPYKVILWLATEQFPNLENDIPAKILNLKKNGLEIKFCDNLKSYKKFFYVGQNYSNYIIVTADDDVLYPENWLNNLLNTYYKNNEEYIVCYRAHGITFKNSKMLGYKEWNSLSEDIMGPSNRLIAIGVGGILYPKNFFDNIVLDKNVILNLAPTTDDIYLKVMEIIKGYNIIKVDLNSKEWFTVKKSQKTSLKRINVETNNINDVSLKKLMLYYNLSDEDFM